MFYEKHVVLRTLSRPFLWLYYFPWSTGTDDPPRIVNGPLSFLP